MTLPFALATALHAQTPPETTGSPASKPAEVQRAEPPPVTTQEPAKAKIAGDRTIVVKRFDFSGNTLFSSDVLARIVAPYTNREITLLEVYEAADRIAAHYHQSGYNLAFVTPPAQKLTEGVVKLEVVEGRVGAVSVEGNKSYAAARIERTLGELQAGSVYKLEDLDSGLRRVNTLPGMNARATLRPGSDYGTSDLLINANEDRVSAGLTEDNYGRENIGELRTTVSGAWNNPLGFGDQLQLLYMQSEGGLLDYGYVGYNAAIGYSGLRAEISYAAAEFEAEVVGAPGISVQGENKNARAGIEYPLRTARDGSSSVSVAITNQQSNADIAGVTLTNAVDMTLLELGATYSRTFTSLAVYQTRFVLAGNGESADRTDCDLNPSNGEDCNKQMLKLDGDLQYVQPLVGRFDAFTRVAFTYSPDPLPPVNPFSLGGPNSVRAYPSSEVRGDRGVFGTLAFRYGFNIGAAQMQLRAFGDSGTAYRIQPIADTSKDSLTSAGVGTDFFWKYNMFRLSAKVDWSTALDSHVSSDGNDQRVFAQIAAGF